MTPWQNIVIPDATTSKCSEIQYWQKDSTWMCILSILGTVLFFIKNFTILVKNCCFEYSNMPTNTSTHVLWLILYLIFNMGLILFDRIEEKNYIKLLEIINQEEREMLVGWESSSSSSSSIKGTGKGIHLIPEVERKKNISQIMIISYMHSYDIKYCCNYSHKVHWCSPSIEIKSGMYFSI